jgi:hypothetical protein
MDMRGRVVAEYRRSKPSGVSQFDFPIYKLARGKYAVVAYDGQTRLASKELIKL